MSAHESCRPNRFEASNQPECEASGWVLFSSHAPTSEVHDMDKLIDDALRATRVYPMVALRYE
jgi:hypothetical protein